MVKKVIFMVMDGLADRPIKEYGYKTPLEKANTPNLDELAKRAQCGQVYTVGNGIRPGSDTSHLSILGYSIDKYHIGRGAIEVSGVEMDFRPGDIAFRGNLGTVDENLNIIDRRAGRVRDTSPFTKAIDGMEIEGIKFIVKPATAHRAGVVMRGKGLSSAITDADPHEEGKPICEVKATDGTKEAEFTARVLNKFLRESYEVLKNLEENKKRREEGLLEANFLLVRGASDCPNLPNFKEKYNMNSCCIAGAGMYKGVGVLLGMDLIKVDGANGLADTNLKGKFETAIKMLEDYEFIFVHVKAFDNIAEDGNFEGKKDFIERTDKYIKIISDGLKDDVLLVITADHTTPCELKAHSADAVPIMFVGETVRVDDVNSFGERSCAKGNLGTIIGKDIMPAILNVMGQLPLTGA